MYKHIFLSLTHLSVCVCEREREWGQQIKLSWKSSDRLHLTEIALSQDPINLTHTRAEVTQRVT